MSSFLLSHEARQDILDIWDFIAQDNADAADRVTAEIRSAILKLAKFPELGHLRRDLADEPLRFWRVHSYLIVYRPKRSPLEIVRILSGYRDIEKLL